MDEMKNNSQVKDHKTGISLSKVLLQQRKVLQQG